MHHIAYFFQIAFAKNIHWLADKFIIRLKEISVKDPNLVLRVISSTFTIKDIIKLLPAVFY